MQKRTFVAMIEELKLLGMAKWEKFVGHNN